MATTWISMINLILRDSGVLGVGQTAQAQDITDQKSRLNMMLDEWKRNRWLVYCLLDLSVECDGSLYYEIGDGATIDYPRPDEIDAAFARQITAAQPNQPDFPLRIIKSYEEYSQIALKQLSAGPSWALFYESDYPTGKLYPYPLMSDQYELHVLVKKELDTIVDTAEDIILPPEYHMALYSNGIQLIRSAYGLPPKPFIDKQARTSLQTLRAANFQVGTLNMPAAIRGVGSYNIWNDSFGSSSRG
jgi:hypothetical protein